MIFYKINKNLDQFYLKNSFLIIDELITEKEAKKRNCLKLLKKEAEKIKISKFQTYWSFGIRKQNTNFK
tara:strand:- start:420 stop:626 length:207 start_codon:yes stop_codon:yes gene_type:complete